MKNSNDTTYAFNISEGKRLHREIVEGIGDDTLEALASIASLAAHTFRLMGEFIIEHTNEEALSLEQVLTTWMSVAMSGGFLPPEGSIYKDDADPELVNDFMSGVAKAARAVAMSVEPNATETGSKTVGDLSAKAIATTNTLDKVAEMAGISGNQSTAALISTLEDYAILSVMSTHVVTGVLSMFSDDEVQQIDAMFASHAAGIFGISTKGADGAYCAMMRAAHTLIAADEYDGGERNRGLVKHIIDGVLGRSKMMSIEQDLTYKATGLTSEEIGKKPDQGALGELLDKAKARRGQA